ncbi:MAG: endonuclease/exonuclease/phosphatase family protein [Anaerolineae bacterium]|nr:endonuclease/exonuclease/phosphatase family protein [Anaerolineae bacterium]MCA9893409.1 endonuclease/exonuclease/phosphatase family protein [Anaerolineae bacterium]
MVTALRIATFNMENLDEDKVPPSQYDAPLSVRIAIMRPQLERLKADVLCLQEVNGQERSGQKRQLLALQEMIAGTRYANYHIASTLTSRDEPYNERNLVILSRFPILKFQQIKHDLTDAPLYRKVMERPADPEASKISWERPIFYAQLDLGNGRILHVINLHLKSRLPTTIEGQMLDRYTWSSGAGWAEGSFVSAMKRVGQALETRILIDSIFDVAEINGDPAPYIVVCGDFNADIDDVTMKAIRGMVEDTGNPGLVGRVMVPCELSVPEQARFTLKHLGKGEMLDHIVASRALLAYYQGTQIHNEIVPDESGAFHTDAKFPESDHAPVVATFELE